MNGLKGGHSGCDIHLGRGNAIKLFMRTMVQLQKHGVRIAELTGGSLANAIPREAVAVIAIPAEALSAVEAIVTEHEELFKHELAAVEPTLAMTLTEADASAELMPLQTQQLWTTVIDVCPNGVQRMSDSVEGVVETSSNIGVCHFKDGKIVVNAMPRSLIDSCGHAFSESIANLFKMAGAELDLSDSYPGWRPNADSPILARMKQVYQELYGREAGVQVVHAGLECGLLGSNTLVGI